MGPGRREDDLACMVAHLAVLQDFSPQHYPRLASGPRGLIPGHTPGCDVCGTGPAVVGKCLVCL